MSFTTDMIQQVWEKGRIVPNNDPATWRQDECGAWIGRREYGDRNSQYGWEIDHIDPMGGDTVSNLRPLQWQNNAARQGGRLNCSVTSSGTKNVKLSPAT